MLLNCHTITQSKMYTVFVSLLVDSLHPFADYLYILELFFIFYEYKRPSTAFSFNWSFAVCMMNIGISYIYLQKKLSDFLYSYSVSIDNYEHYFFCTVCLSVCLSMFLSLVFDFATLLMF